MKLLIAIPALNEEANIENIIQRCLSARNDLIGNAPITEVAITVVSDGSTDRTVELARRHTHNIQLIVFEKNRGYGAAMQEIDSLNGLAEEEAIRAIKALDLARH